jgi:drug/metabolite transporter (DMT)-like permease
VPVFGVLGAVVINGETVRLAQVVGGVIVIAGMAVGWSSGGRS